MAVGQTLINDAARGEIISRLKEAGLTMYEAATYAALLSHWPASAAALCEETGISDTKIYHVLESLQKKGMIAIQHGRPTLFKPLPPKEAITNLRKQLQDEFARKMRRLELLASKIHPLYEKSAGEEELELAYVIKGFTGVMNRMKSLIESAKKEIVLYIPDRQVFEKLKETIVSAKKRGVSVQLAVAQDVVPILSSPTFSGYKVLAQSCENCWAAIKDDEALLTVTEWRTSLCSGILTQDPSLIAMSRSWLTNPACCY